VDGGSAWWRASTTRVHRALAIDPRAPATIYGISADSQSILKSTDGGATWLPVYAPTGQSELNALLVDPAATGFVYAGVSHADGLAQVLRSTDNGATWNPALPQELRGQGGIGRTHVTALAALHGATSLVLAGVQVYHGGTLARSLDRGASWSLSYTGNLTPLAFPSALAVAGGSPADAAVYLGMSVMGHGSLVRSDDGGLTWANLSERLPIRGPSGSHVSSLTTHPRQPGWVYMAQHDQATPQRTGVFASPDRGQNWAELGHLQHAVVGPQGLALAVPSHTLYAATSAGIYQATITWPVLPRFADYYDAHDGYRVLGSAISLESRAGGYGSQYFEKGRLEDHTGESPDPNWQLMYGLLVDDLKAAGAPLPVGGDVSPLTYAGLRDLADAAHRVAPPEGYPGTGTMGVDADGTTFVPFAIDLNGGPGHLVPGEFWRYINRDDLFPGGWLHDVGLPVTPAQEVQVTKLLPEGPQVRTILVQAFQRTILTHDPANPPDWRTERANVGSDYRRHYSERVGP
jgi:hypothetical protein